MKCPPVSLIFLKRSLVFPILLFSSISLHCSLKKAFLSLLAILWNSAFSWVSSLSPLPFVFLLSSAICKVCLDSHFVFLHFFFFEMVLVTAPCTVLQTSVVVLQVLCVPGLILWICLSPPWRKGFDLGHTWMAQFFPGGSDGRELICNPGDHDASLVKKISWWREWQPSLVFLAGELHGQRSLAGYSPWAHKESEQLTLSLNSLMVFPTSWSCMQ